MNSDSSKTSAEIDESGSVAFLAWLREGIVGGDILVNEPSSATHIVTEGVFILAPAIFKQYLKSQGLDENLHSKLSRRFARLRQHIPSGDINIHSYWVCTANRASKINGWILPFNVIYENDYPIPKPNKYIHKNLDDNVTKVDLNQNKIHREVNLDKTNAPSANYGERMKGILKQLDGLSIRDIKSILCNVDHEIEKGSEVSFSKIESVDYIADLRPSR